MSYICHFFPICSPGSSPFSNTFDCTVLFSSTILTAEELAAYLTLPSISSFFIVSSLRVQVIRQRGHLKNGHYPHRPEYYGVNASSLTMEFEKGFKPVNVACSINTLVHQQYNRFSNRLIRFGFLFHVLPLKGLPFNS